MHTVSHLLSIMDSDFLDFFLTDARNAPLIQQLRRYSSFRGVTEFTVAYTRNL